MSIKKLAILIFCAVLTCFALVSCEDEIGDYQYDWEPEPTIKLEYDLYIITNSGNDEDSLNAMTTVNSKLNQYFDGLYDTVLDIHYISEENYDAEIAALIANGANEETVSGRQNGGAIVLVRGEEMYNTLIEGNHLADVAPLLDTNAFGKLNTQITSALLDSAFVGDELYVIPNDHIIGNYEYTIINRELAEGKLNFSAQSELLEMLIVDGEANEIAAELIDAVSLNLELLGVESVDDVIRVVPGAYEDKALWEAKGYICNVSKYPTVDASNTFKSGFAILNTKDVYVKGSTTELLIDAAGCVERAMEIVYSINADKTARNILQYGVENTHFKFVNKEITLEDGSVKTVTYVTPLSNNAYNMNLLYTGDVFNAYYTDSIVYTDGDFTSDWSYFVVMNGDAQNKDAVISE